MGSIDSTEINGIINNIDGIDSKEISRLTRLIKEDPSSSDLYLLRDYIYQELINSGKSIQELEKVFNNDELKKQEKRLCTYKAIYNGDLNIGLSRWAYLLGLTDESKTFYDFIKNLGMYVNIDNKNVFYQNLNKFIVEENFDFDSYEKLFNRKTHPYPSNQKIVSNFKSIQGKGGNCIKELGIYGELCSYLYAKQELEHNKMKDLANRSIWVARDIGDHFGYDVFSFNNDKEEMIIEVKATNSKKFEQEKDNFYMTVNEFEKMKQFSKEYDYYVVRVYTNNASAAELYYLKPNNDGSVEYGDIKYVPSIPKDKSKDKIDFKRVPKKKVFKIGGIS